MRDPVRRQRTLRLIEDIWLQPANRDLRLYQLLGNATLVDGDPYDYEDYKLEAALEMYTRRPGHLPAND